MKTSFKFFRLSCIIETANPGTLWKQSLHETEKRPRQRVDSLIALERVFIRDLKAYVYSIKLGRLRILLADNKQKGLR